MKAISDLHVYSSAKHRQIILVPEQAARISMTALKQVLRPAKTSVVNMPTAGKKVVSPWGARRGHARGRARALLVEVVRLQLFLQGQQRLVALVQAPRQRRHDVALLHQQRPVPVRLHK